MGASLTLAASIAMASSSAATNAVQQEMVRYDNVRSRSTPKVGPIIVMLPRWDARVVTMTKWQITCSKMGSGWCALNPAA